jgi:DNA polymerase III subunit delta'
MSKKLFSDIIGHEDVKEMFARAIEHDSLAHAYLFVGSEGIGKMAFSEALLEHLFSQVTPSSSPLKRGRTLQNHPDIIRIERLVDEKTGKKKSVISAEQIRSLKERFALSSLSGRKAAVIKEANRLNSSSANAFLKTLEEPSGNTIFMLHTEHIESVPATIASRCQIIRFPFVSSKTIASALVKRGVSKKEAEHIASISLGRPGIALRLLKDGEYRAQREMATSGFLELVEEKLPERLHRISIMLPKAEVNKATVVEEVLNGWELMARDILLHTIQQPAFAVSKNETDRLKQISQRINSNKACAILKRISNARQALKSNINPQLALEHVVIHI